VNVFDIRTQYFILKPDRARLPFFYPAFSRPIVFSTFLLKNNPER